MPGTMATRSPTTSSSPTDTAVPNKQKFRGAAGTLCVCVCVSARACVHVLFKKYILFCIILQM